MKKLLICLFMTSTLLANAQVRRLGILGSSTANGQGVPFDSSWVQLLKTKYRAMGLIDTLHKVAASTYDCYTGMPTGYVPPAGRNSPNPSYNITRLMSRVPAPTTVIINYPTTNYNILSDQEILFCLDSIRKYANSYGAKVFIATTQPRDSYDNAGRARLKYLHGVISAYFGDSTIDFFTPLNNPADNKIRAMYSVGDRVHPNSAGQRVLYGQVLAKNVFNINMATAQRVLIDVGESGSTTRSPDALNRWWNNMTDARKGVRVSNAVTTGGERTTINLEVVNPLASTVAGNLNVGSGGEVGGIEEYGASATKDHALLLPGISNGTWRLSGLDPAKDYTIRFWGGFTGSGYRILQAKMAEQTVWQEYNAGNNKLYGTAANFFVTGKTEQTFNFRVKTNSVAAHISVVDILATSSLDEIPEPPNELPSADAGADTTVTLPDSLQLKGTGSDPDGIVTYAWSQLSGPALSTFNAPAIADPVVKFPAAGTYQYELLVSDNDGAVDKDTVVITVKPAPVVLVKQRVLIDLGQAATTTGTDQWGKRWNNVTDLRAGVRLTNAVTTNNQPTTIRMEVVRPAGSTGPYDLNVRTSNNVGVVGEYPASATSDNGLADKVITNGRWKFSGLTASLAYTVKFWGSYNQGGSRVIQIRRPDDSTWLELNTAQNLDYNRAASFTFTGVTEAAFHIRVKTGSNFAYVNVIDITAASIIAPSARAIPSTQPIVINQPVHQSGLIHPNPTNGMAMLRMFSPTQAKGEVVVINTSGQAVRTISFSKAAGSFLQAIDLTSHAAGLYFIRVRLGSETSEYRLLKK